MRTLLGGASAWNRAASGGVGRLFPQAGAAFCSVLTLEGALYEACSRRSRAAHGHPVTTAPTAAPGLCRAISSAGRRAREAMPDSDPATAPAPQDPMPQPP